MKKLLAIATLAVALTGYSQTNEPPSVPGTEGFEKVLTSLATISNWVAVPYYTYAPDAPHQHGGGLLAIYNINNYVGAGFGFDWLGNFNLFSGQATLRYPIPFLKWTHNEWLSQVYGVPFGIAGLGVPIGGAEAGNGGTATIAGVGVSFVFPQGKTWDWGFGYATTQWTGAGDYDGFHHQVFARISLKF